MRKSPRTKRHQVDFELLKHMISTLPQVPKGRSGNFSVSHKVHEADKPMTVVSMRNAIMMNQQPTEIVLDHPHIIRYLKEGDGILMSDSPQEVYQMREPLTRVSGNVLVGGLGLGVFSHLAGIQSTVDLVTTVEQSSDVIKLVADHVIGVVLHDDLFRFLRSVDFVNYDCAYFDIWSGTGESTWVDYVVPLRRLCRGRIKQTNVYCWNEEEMKGQLREGLRRAAHYDHKIVPYYEPLRLVAQELHITNPVIRTTQTPETHDELLTWFEIGQDNYKLRRLIDHYLSPGTDDWERDFGNLWDLHIPKGDDKHK